MYVHNDRGGKQPVPHDQATAIDILRLFVEEEVGKSSMVIAAMQAFDNITLGGKESWLATGTRLVQYYRASKLDPEAPYASEDEYF